MRSLAAVLVVALLSCHRREPPLPAIGANARALFPVNPDGRWGYIDRAGVLRIEARFERAYDFSEGLAAVRSGGKYGYIDTAGGWVILPAYDFVGRFVSGLAAVKQGERWGFVTRAGKFTQTPEKAAKESDSFKDWAALGGRRFSGRSEGLEAAGVSNRWGYRTVTGRLAIPAQYEEAWDFAGGLAAVTRDADMLYIDRQGRVVWQPVYPVKLSPADWTFSQNEATFEASVLRLSGRWDVQAEPLRSGDLSIRFLREGEAAYVFDGHRATVFDLSGGTLYYAHFSPQTCGCTVVAVDLSSGSTLWTTWLRAAGTISHSLYSNRVNLRVEGDRVIICGDEWREYVEVLDATTGRILGHHVFGG